MTKTSVVYPIIGALKEAEKLLGEGSWEGSNDKQKEFITNTLTKEFNGLEELESISSWKTEDINKFLADRGFSIKIEELKSSEFGIASVLKLILEWLKKGENVDFYKYGKTYQGVKLTSGFTCRRNLNNSVFCLDTKSGDKVYLYKVEEEPSNLENKVKELSNIGENYEFYDYLIFPKVDLDREEDVRWLLKISYFQKNGMPWDLTQAIQQTKFKMDEVGAKVESAFAGAMMMRGIKPIKGYTIDSPFLCWIERDGLDNPLFIGYITKDSWVEK